MTRRSRGTHPCADAPADRRTLRTLSNVRAAIQAPACRTRLVRILVAKSIHASDPSSTFSFAVLTNPDTPNRTPNEKLPPTIQDTLNGLFRRKLTACRPPYRRGAARRGWRSSRSWGVLDFGLHRRSGAGMICSRHYTTAHEAFRGRVREFLERECAPRRAEWQQAGRTPREIWRKAGELGLLCSDIPTNTAAPAGIFATRSCSTRNCPPGVERLRAGRAQHRGPLSAQSRYGGAEAPLPAPPGQRRTRSGRSP